MRSCGLLDVCIDKGEEVGFEEAGGNFCSHFKVYDMVEKESKNLYGVPQGKVLS